MKFCQIGDLLVAPLTHPVPHGWTATGGGMWRVATRPGPVEDHVSVVKPWITARDTPTTTTQERDTP